LLNQADLHLFRFYTDAYDLFVIGIAKPMIATVYFPQLNGKLQKADDLAITGVALVGTLCGQVRMFCLQFLSSCMLFMNGNHDGLALPKNPRWVYAS
jgi:hypothetical protein